MLTRMCTSPTPIMNSNPVKLSVLSGAYSELHLENFTYSIWEWLRKNILLFICSEMHHKKGEEKRVIHDVHFSLSTKHMSSSLYFFIFRVLLFGYRNLTRTEIIPHANLWAKQDTTVKKKYFADKEVSIVRYCQDPCCESCSTWEK